MKIKESITLGIIMLTLASSALAGENGKEMIQTLDNTFNLLNEQMNGLNADTPAGSPNSSAALEKFQGNLWRAMALDPGPVTLVPPSQVPKNLFANELNAELAKQFEEVKHLNVPQSAQAEFNKYLSLSNEILNHRKNRQFPQARAFAKRGTLDQDFQAVLQKIPHEKTAGVEVDLTPLKATVASLKNQVASISAAATPNKDDKKKDVFANGNQFVWSALAAVLGFFFGIAGYRMNPDFFHRYLTPTDSIAPTATTHSAEAKLDYARWLKEFEEILTRLKSSQMTHERRIEDMVLNSEKMSHHAMSLYSDARIKNEANLEHRMSTLLRAVQQQMEQGQKLQSGDRIQVNVMLEHCLRLCDGIESGNIYYDRSRMVEPPHMRVSA